MEWVTTTGRTVEEAKDAALDELGVDEVDAEFEVLEEPRAGLFGRQRGEARVRARVRPTAPRPKVERRNRRPNTRSSARGANGGSSGSSPTPATPASDTAAPTDTEEGPDVEQELTLAEQGQIAEQFVVGLLE